MVRFFVIIFIRSWAHLSHGYEINQYIIIYRYPEQAKRFSFNQQRFLEQKLWRHQDSNPRPTSACLGMTSVQRFCGSLIIPSHWTLEEHSCRRQSCQADTRHYYEHVHSEKGVEHSVTQPCATGAGIQFGLSLSEA